MPKGVYERKPGRRKKVHHPPGSGWGRRKEFVTEPRSKDPETIFKFRCDKLCREIEERLALSVKIYRSKDWSQEFLRSLVDLKSLYA